MFLRRIVAIPPLVSVRNAAFTWPDKDEVMQIQDKHRHLMPSKCNLHSDLGSNSEGAVLMQHEAASWQLRICIIGHTTSAGREGANPDNLYVLTTFGEP